MLNYLKRLITSEDSLRQEQEAYFKQHGRYLQTKRGGYRVDVFEAPTKRGEPTVHGYTLNKEP